jgi:hypothetical protein
MPLVPRRFTRASFFVPAPELLHPRLLYSIQIDTYLRGHLRNALHRASAPDFKPQLVTPISQGSAVERRGTPTPRNEQPAA